MEEKRLTREEKIKLLEISRRAIEDRAKKDKAKESKVDGEGLNAKNGAFVSIHKKGELRGCIGTFSSSKPLYKTIQEMAVSSANNDPRFPPLSKEELSEIDIEISVLSPLKKIEDVNEIEVGTHGIYIMKGFYKGVLLPQVAVEYGWDRDTFLQHTCLKAGLNQEAWKEDDTEIFIFDAQVFGEKGKGL